MNAVIWLESALDALADIWVTVAPDERERIEGGVDRINRTLARDRDAGESREGNNRVLHVVPVTVRFRVEPGPVVVVYQVHFVRPRRGNSGV